MTSSGKCRMKERILWILILHILTCVAFSGCVQRVQLYPGSEQSPFRVSKLRIRGQYNNRHLNLRVDGEPVQWERNGKSVDVEVLRGRHELKWYLMPPDVRTHEPLRDAGWFYKGEGVLDAKGGKEYEFKCEFLIGDKRLVETTRDWSTTVYYYRVTVKDYATWIEDAIWGKVVAGRKPQWTGWHTCEICDQKKAAVPCEYGCYKCRAKSTGQF